MKQFGDERYVIGYMIFDDTGNLFFWCKPIALNAFDLPKTMVYRSILLIGIGYSYQFAGFMLRYINVQGNASLVNIQEIRFEPNNILVHSGIIIGHTISQRKWTHYENRVGAALQIYKRFENFVFEYPIDDIYSYNRSLIGMDYLCTHDFLFVCQFFQFFCLFLFLVV